MRRGHAIAQNIVSSGIMEYYLPADPSQPSASPQPASFLPLIQNTPEKENLFPILTSARRPNETFLRIPAL